MATSPIDFSGIAAALLARAESLVPEWLPGGRRQGREWVCGDSSGGKGRSFSVNLESGAFADFATDVRGGDLIALYATIHTLSQAEAAFELAEKIGYGLERAPVDGHPKRNGSHPASDLAAEPAPADAPLPKPAGLIGRWAYYRNAEEGPILVVCRLEPVDGKKQFRQFTWRGGHWSPKGLAAPRPLYRLPVLLGHPEMPVVVCEGEKACEAAQAALPDHVVTTWSQGAQSVAKTDFTPLAGRHVTLWPDADDAGRKAMAQIAQILLPLGGAVSVIDTANYPPGWDAADADPVEIPSLIESAKSIEPPPKPERHGRANPMRPNGRAVIDSSTTAATPGDESAFVIWQQTGVSAPGRANANGVPHPNESNIALIVRGHPKLRGRVWYDTFRDKVYWRDQNDVVRPWTDDDTRMFLDYLQGTLMLPKVTKPRVHDGVLIAALKDKRSSVIEYLDSLTHDGQWRLETWLSKCFDAPLDPHHCAVARNWLVAMCARAYDPGCQVDNIVVLEGDSSIGKTSALRIIGGEWSASLKQKFGSKEFQEAMQGYWLIEIPDLAGYTGGDHLRAIAEISERNDTYRVPWDRLASEHPRRCVLTMSTEQRAGYVSDTFGTRRYWTVACKRADLDWLRENRDQLFAEAVMLYKRGDPWHLMPTQTREEQLERVEQDIYHSRVADWLMGRTETTAAEVFDAIFAEYDSFGKVRRAATQRDARRIGKILRRLEWVPIQIWRDGRKQNGWVAPRMPIEADPVSPP